MEETKRKILAYTELSEFRRRQITKLAECVPGSGAPWPSMSVDDDLTDLPHFFVGMSGCRPVSYAEWFYDGQKTIEIGCFVHPDFRQRGYLREMLSKMQQVFSGDEELLKAHRCLVYQMVKNGRPVCAAELENAAAVCSHLKAERVQCDYLLRLTGREKQKGTLPDGVTSLLKTDESVTELILYRENTSGKRKIKIGSARIIKGETQCVLCDVFVKPEERGRGFGKYLVGTLAVRCGELPLLLHVDGDNQTALGLYRKLGCEVVEQLVYYRLKPLKLE